MVSSWDKVGLKRGRWTAEEDRKLADYIAQHGEGSWSSLPKKTGLQRCGRSCRLRWVNYLKDGVKRGDITEEEDELIVKLHATYGNRWSIIASHMPGRTDNEIKNHWKSYLSRQILSVRRTYTTDDDTTITIDITTLPMARTSRKKKKKKKLPAQAKNDAREASSLSPSAEMVNTTLTGIGPLGKTQVDDHLDMDQWDREGLVAHLWAEQNHTSGEPQADKVESFMRWLLSNV